jgi:transposase
MDRTTPRPPVELTAAERKFLEARAAGMTVDAAAAKAKKSQRWAYYTLNRYRRKGLNPARAN